MAPETPHEEKVIGGIKAAVIYRYYGRARRQHYHMFALCLIVLISITYIGKAALISSHRDKCKFIQRSVKGNPGYKRDKTTNNREQQNNSCRSSYHRLQLRSDISLNDQHQGQKCHKESKYSMGHIACRDSDSQSSYGKQHMAYCPKIIFLTKQCPLTNKEKQRYNKHRYTPDVTALKNVGIAEQSQETIVPEQSKRRCGNKIYKEQEIYSQKSSKESRHLTPAPLTPLIHQISQFKYENYYP